MFSLIISAEVCFKESLPSVSNAVKSCVSVGGNVTCTHNCKAGYVYYDGSTSKQYHCSGANNWFPSASPEDCLSKYHEPIVTRIIHKHFYKKRSFYENGNMKNEGWK